MSFMSCSSACLLLFIVFVQAIFFRCPKTWPIYNVCSMFLLNISSIDIIQLLWDQKFKIYDF